MTTPHRITGVYVPCFDTETDWTLCTITRDKRHYYEHFQFLDGTTGGPWRRSGVSIRSAIQLGTIRLIPTWLRLPEGL